MPELIHAEQLRASLGALAPALDSSAAVRHYQSFYGLDMPKHPKMQSRLGLVRVQDYEVVTQLWWPPEPRATLIVLHGYYDHMGLYRHVLDWALSMGFCMLSCDLPGHGLSSGVRASIRSFEEYQQVLQALLQEARRLQLPTPWHLMGQSTGSAIVLDHLLHQPPDAALGRSILMAPLVRPRDWWRGRLAYRLLKHFVEWLPRHFSDNSGDPAFLDFIKTRDPLQPRTLPTAWVGALDRWIPQIETARPSSQQPIIIQGEQDATVDWQYNLPILQAKFHQPDILRLPEARHHLANECEPIRLRYFEFLRGRMP